MTLIQPPVHKSRSGLTLIELLVATALSSLIFILLINSLIGFFRNRQRAVSLASLQKIYSNVIVDITNNTRWANIVQISPDTNSIIVYIPDSSDTITYQYSDPKTLTKTSNIAGNTTRANLIPLEVVIPQFQLTVPTSAGDPPRYFNLQMAIQSTVENTKTYQGTSTVSVRLNQIGNP